MEGLITTVLTHVQTTTSLVLLMFMLVVTGMLVPRWRYNELKEDLKAYEESSKTLLMEFKELAALVTKESVNGSYIDSSEEKSNESS